jgi:uncharacterized protein YbjT (DUF2867 family)
VPADSGRTQYLRSDLVRRRRASCTKRRYHPGVAPGHVGAHYDVTGPEALSYADVAARLTSALGRRISYAGASDDAVRQALLDAGLTEWFASALIGLYQDYRRSGTAGYAAQVAGTVPRLTGRPARSLDDLLGEIAPGLSS